MTTRKTLSNKASDLLQQFHITAPPIDVEAIARELNIVVLQVDFDSNVSGLLARKDDGPAVIGVNRKHSKVRQRFSIAHEIGHFLLHDPKPIFVDNLKLQFRNNVSSQGVAREEIEANTFAAELLMPEEFIRRDVEKLDFITNSNITTLASDYVVSREAFIYRITNLGYIEI